MLTLNSIPAAEHSTITSWLKTGEARAYKNMLEAYDTPLVAVVSDSFDLESAVRQIWGLELKDIVLSRNGTTIIRPDSGKPTEIVPDLLDWLGEVFGYTVNTKGYKLLPPQVRIIQDDGIGRRSIKGILEAVMNRGWSADNVAFGCGAGLLQDVNRDVIRFAMKASAIDIDGELIDVFKDPKTDPNKASKRGILKLVYENGQYETRRVQEPGEDVMRAIFRDGKILAQDDFKAIRERAELPELKQLFAHKKAA